MRMVNSVSYVSRHYFHSFSSYPGKGAVYGYDAVGSFKRDEYGAMGSGQNFIMPVLDNLVIIFSNIYL